MVSKKNIGERKGLPLWVWAVEAALVATVILLGYRTLQTEQRFNVAKSSFKLKRSDHP